MTTDGKITDKQLQYYINKKDISNKNNSTVEKLINMNILQVKKNYRLIKEE